MATESPKFGYLCCNSTFTFTASCKTSQSLLPSQSLHAGTPLPQFSWPPKLSEAMKEEFTTLSILIFPSCIYDSTMLRNLRSLAINSGWILPQWTTLTAAFVCHYLPRAEKPLSPFSFRIWKLSWVGSHPVPVLIRTSLNGV